jgi:serine/threonine protein kinase
VQVTGYYGRGSQFEVNKWKSNCKPKSFARKIISADVKDENEKIKCAEMIRREAAFIKRLSGHRHIISLLRVIDDKVRPYIDMPCFERDLDSFFALKSCTNSSHRDVFKRQVMRWVGSATSAIKFMHSKGILHGDIKPRNILVKGKEIVFTDFGISRDLSETTVLHEWVGCSFEYAGPEGRFTSQS